MTKLFRVMPKCTKCSDGIGLTPEMVVVGEYYSPFNEGIKDLLRGIYMHDVLATTTGKNIVQSE